MIVVAAVLGGLIGSFLNVVIYRVPKKLSIASPPSACPNCGMAIKPYDNIPVLSWVLLRGRCRGCHSTISIRYPLVELLTAVFFAAVAVALAPDLTGPAATVASGLLELTAFLYLAAVTVALALIDIDTHTLPNSIVLPSYVVAVALLFGSALAAARWDDLLRASIGMVALGGLYFIIHLISPRGMGGGDVKLAGVLGLYLAWVGWGGFAVGALAAFILGGLFGAILIVTRKAGRKSGIPFGPWMLLGAWLGILVGEQLWAAYLSLFGLTASS